MSDEAPGGGYRGWADIVARRLADDLRAAGGAGPFRYANLAIRGRLFDAIVDEQVPAALRLRADLVSFAGGGNDVLRRSFDPAAMLARFDNVVGTLRASGADVIIFRWADITSRLPGKRLVLPRMRILNQAVGDVTEKYGAILVDLWHDPEFHNPQLWSEDRLHMSGVGHHRVAAHVLTALGVEPDAAWLAKPEPPRAAAGSRPVRPTRAGLASTWPRGSSGGCRVGPVATPSPLNVPHLIRSWTDPAGRATMRAC